MTARSDPGEMTPAAQEVTALRAEITRLNKMVTALMNRAERDMSTKGSDFGIFHTAVTLEKQVRERTQELEAALRENERINRALQREKDEQRLLIKQLEDVHQQLLQSEKLASIGQLAAGIAHEINNPMGFIQSNLGTLKNYGETLKEYVQDIDLMATKYSEAEQKHLAELRSMLDIDFLFEDMPTLISESVTGAKRVRDIVQTLKSFSHVDQAEVLQININDCINNTVETAASTLKQKATVVKEFGELPLLECRPHEMSQLFLNLLLNASQAIAQQGEIRVKTSLEGDMIVIAVSDTGCGIPQEIIGRIFEPFFTTREVGKGTGLGLSMCYDIVKKHNGKIDVESTVGAGTTFTIRLPTKPSATS
jgi:two-component system NtrC family sensor kinase